jgi:DNA-binding NarL/FixJ family response regulator
MCTSSPRFLLVDDHALFRSGLGMMLSQSWAGVRIAQAATWQEAVQALQHVEPDLILLDVHLPDGHGLAALVHLAESAPGCPVVLMSAEADAVLVHKARQAGARGFLPKSAGADEVLATVRAALQGESAFGAVRDDMRSACDASASGTGPARMLSDSATGLSERQLAILHYLGRATPNKAIARQLGLSESEVRAEVSWLTERLGARSREEAYALALSRGWIQP